MSETNENTLRVISRLKSLLKRFGVSKQLTKLVKIFGVHPTQVTLWKKELTDQASRDVIKSTGNYKILYSMFKFLIKPKANTWHEK